MILSREQEYMFWESGELCGYMFSGVAESEIVGDPRIAPTSSMPESG